MSEITKIIAPPRRRRFIELIFNGFGQALCAIAVAIILKSVFDESHPEGAAQTTLVINGAILLAAAAFLSWLKYHERVTAEWLGQNYVAEIRETSFAHLMRLSNVAQTRLRDGAVLLRFVNDLSALRQWVSIGLARLLVAASLVAMSLAGLLLINPLIGAALSLTVAVGAVSALALGVGIDASVRAARRQRALMAARLNERISQLSVIQAFSKRRDERKRLRRRSRKLGDALVARAKWIAALRAVVQLAVSISIALVAVGGIWMFNRGLATRGELVAAISVVGLFTPALYDLGRVFEYWRSSRIAREKLASLLGAGPVLSTKGARERLAASAGMVEFQNVTVNGLIRNFSGAAPGNGLTVVKGPNGAGKSTLLLLMLRLLEPDSGAVKIDGQNIALVQANSLRRKISIASLDFPLFRGSVESNILYSAPDLPRSRLEAIASACHISIADDGNGGLHLDKAVAEHGSNLSTGQQIRVMLARAIARRPRILLFDEIDAHLDEDGLAAFSNVIRSHKGSVIAVTHNETLLRQADAVWNLSETAAGQTECRGQVVKLHAGDVQ